MTDKFQSYADTPSAPATRVAGVTPSDTAPLTDLPKALYVGVGGSIVLAGATGGDATLQNVPDGCVLPVRASYVRATGTTASAIVALY